MGLEAANFLSELVLTNPTGSDFKYEGDNHLRLLKTVLQNTFPGLAGRFNRTQSKAAGYTPVLNDSSSVFECTATLTMTMTAAATLGSGWSAFFVAAGGNVTIDPNGAETINGAATLVIPQNHAALVFCDGTGFRAIVSRLTAYIMPVTTRAANTILGVADIGKVFRATAAFTQTLDAAATLGNGWYCHYHIDAGITMVFDPNGAETINGAATKTITGPASYILVSDGTNIQALGEIAVLADGETDVATAATPAIFATASRIVRLTGTTDITAFDTAAKGNWRFCHFESTGARLVNGANLTNPIPFDIQVRAGDSMMAEAMGGGVTKIHWFRRKDGEFLYGGRIPFGVIIGGVLDMPASNTRYAMVQGQGGTATENDARIIAPEAGTLSELRVKGNVNLAGGTVVVTARKNQADTPLTCTVPDGGSAASDLVNTLNVDQGDEITFKFVSGAIGAGGPDFGFSCVFKKRGMNVGVPTQFCFNSRGSSLNDGINTQSVGRYGVEASESHAEIPVSACRIEARSSFSVSAGTAGVYGVSVRRNALSTSFNNENWTPLTYDTSVRVIGGGARGALVGFSVDQLYNARGTYAQQTNATQNRGWYNVFGPSEVEYPPSSIFFHLKDMAQNLTRYAQGYLLGAVPIATESEVQVPMPACTGRNLRAASNAAVAAGNTVVTVRKNGADQALTCSLGTGSRIASDTSNSVVFAADDLMSMKVVSGAATGTRTYNIGMDLHPL